MLRVILIFLRAIVLQTVSPTECIDNSMFCVNSPTKPTLAVFSPTKRSTQQKDYRHGGQHRCIVSPTVCRTINTPVKTSVSIVLLCLGLSIHYSRPVYQKSYFI